jgi:DNA repair exonuclease SbcCD ATPase subunit
MMTSLALLVSACGVQFTYNRLDWVIPWYLDDYIELSDQQNTLFERRLASQLNWHRNTQLPEYSRQLRQLSVQVQDGLTLAELDDMSERFRAVWQTLVNQLTPDIAALLATASDDQIGELFDNIEKRNEKYRRKYVDLPEAELREKRAERVVENIERWLGQITPAQQKQVDAWSRRFEATADLTLAYPAVSS